jgi:hypothetical protein
MIKYLF